MNDETATYAVRFGEGMIKASMNYMLAGCAISLIGKYVLRKNHKND